MYRTYTPNGTGAFLLVGEYPTLEEAKSACVVSGDRVEQITENGSTVTYIHA